MTVASRLIVIFTCITSFVYANMAPSYPEPGTIWKSGQNYEITWFDDKQSPNLEKSWKRFKIDFMTGDNNSQKFLKNVARDLDAREIKSINWTAPEVEPHSAIYFFMFTNDKGEHAWTTRFGITGQDGKLDKPEFSKQPDGDKIPWGVGKLVTPTDNSKPSATFSMNPEMSSVAEKNANVQIAVSNDPDTSNANTIIPTMALLFSITLFVMNYMVFF